MRNNFRLTMFTQFDLQKNILKGSFTAKQGGAEFGYHQPMH